MGHEQSQGDRASNHEEQEVDSKQLGAEAVARAKQQEALSEATQDIDDLLDAMDDILEENAQEFVASFVQKGGQ